MDKRIKVLEVKATILAENNEKAVAENLLEHLSLQRLYV